MNYCVPLMIEDLKNGISAKEVRNYYYGVPEELGDIDLTSGVIMVNPVSTEIMPVATGVLDKDEDIIEIIVAKSYKTSIYQNASNAGDMAFLTRIMRGKDSNNDILTNSIVYIIRNNFRRYGLNQPSMSINWNENRFNKEGVIAATLTLRQSSINEQSIN